MSRTTLTVLTAAALMAASIGVMVCRYHALGAEIQVPHSPNTWKITMKVNGTTTGPDAKLLTITPLDFASQHIKGEQCRSAELLDKPPAARHPDRREVIWSQRAGAAPGPFHAYYEFYCACDVHRPTASMSRLTKTLYAAPQPGKYLTNEPGVPCDHADVSALARRLTVGCDSPGDQVEALFRYVQKEVGNEPSVGGPGVGAVECLNDGRGDSGAKSRLLVALCRNRGVPARLVTGLWLPKGPEQTAQVWCEAWVRDQWLPMCPLHDHPTYYGHVPSTFMILGLGDQRIVHGFKVRDLSYKYLIERTAPEGLAAADPSPLRRLFKLISFDALPPTETRFVEFLLLLPIAALIVCVCRNVIGINSFGSFAPALVGLAFRELYSLPGILIFVSIVLLGWGLRRVLDYYHLMQVPRTAFMLSLVVVFLITAVVVANLQPTPIQATKYIPLFPMVILTGMIERFWMLETEDGTSSSFRTLFGTLLIAVTIATFLSWHAVIDHMFFYPETLGLIMAGQLLIGRYTGYRLSELFRFRDFVTATEA